MSSVSYSSMSSTVPVLVRQAIFQSARSGTRTGGAGVTQKKPTFVVDSSDHLLTC